MKARVTAITVDIKHIPELENEKIRDSFAAFGGKNAGICYMADDYDKLENEEDTKSILRFIRTIKNTHHSISDHCNITVVFEEVPKFFAMVMNSFQVYATSEKSARYTVMKNLSEEEQRLYDKWIDKIKKVLMENYEVGEKDATKLAQENARYFISVFSPATTFSYTASLRQWNYIHQWMKEFTELPFPEDSKKDFIDKVIVSFKDFIDWFKESLIYNEIFTDLKGRKIDFLLPLYPGTKSIIPEDETIADSYCINYRVSMASLAQLQRHRSIKYDIGDFLFDMYDYMMYCPTFIIKNEELQREWCEDMIALMPYYPQGKVVTVVERGTIDKFLLKCDERLCGRVQLETMEKCRVLLGKMYEYGKFSPYYEDQVRNWICGMRFGEFEIHPKCEMRGSCADNGCIHGPKNALHRDF
jgi:hypothetical protein